MSKTGHERVFSGRKRMLSSAVVVMVGVILIGLLGWQSVRQHFSESKNISVRLAQLKSDIALFDEILTMSSRMAAYTGDLKWEDRYRLYEVHLDSALTEALEISMSNAAREAVASVEDANIKLIAMENQGFKLVRIGSKEEAQKLLLNSEYEELKKQYAGGIERLDKALLKAIAGHTKEDRRVTRMRIAMVLLLMILIVAGWALWTLTIRRREYVLERVNAELEQKTREVQEINRTLEDRVKERTQNLQEAYDEQKRFRTLIDHAKDIICIIEFESGRILNVNRAFTEMTGYTEKELLGMTIPDIEVTLSDEGAWQKFVAMIAEKRSHVMEGRFARKDGFKVPIEINMNVISQKDREYMVAVARDITERKRAENKLKRSKKETEDKARQLRETTAQLIQTEKMTALGELAAGVAHELNQPLNGIKITCQEMLRDIEKDRFEFKELPGSLQEVVGLVDRQADIINHMRIFSRQSVGEEVEEIDVNNAVEGALKLIGQQLAVHNFYVESNLNDSIPHVMANTPRLEQILLNLMLNARDALEQSSVEEKRIGIATSVRHSGTKDAEVLVEVEDNGGGVPEHIRDRIFEPFFTTKRPQDGTGLGLSICLRIAEQFGGRIELDVKEGIGSLFRVVIPAATEDAL